MHRTTLRQLLRRPTVFACVEQPPCCTSRHSAIYPLFCCRLKSVVRNIVRTCTPHLRNETYRYSAPSINVVTYCALYVGGPTRMSHCGFQSIQNNEINILRGGNLIGNPRPYGYFASRSKNHHRCRQFTSKLAWSSETCRASC